MADNNKICESVSQRRKELLISILILIRVLMNIVTPCPDKRIIDGGRRSVSVSVVDNNVKI